MKTMSLITICIVELWSSRDARMEKYNGGFPYQSYKFGGWSVNLWSF
jgi:hypothetical protein